MAVTSIWRIKGKLTGVIAYVKDKNKTTLESVIGYASNPNKTLLTPENELLSRATKQAAEEGIDVELGDEEGSQRETLVSGINCNPASAVEEMLAVKRRFGKEDGTAAYHGYQSFAEGEVTPEQCHELGVKLAQELWGDRYQVIVTTHLDHQNHLHNHFVLNTVSFVDGKKFYRSEKDYYQMRQVSDRLCREYQLSVIQHPGSGKAMPYNEWQEGKKRSGGGRKAYIQADVDAAIRSAYTPEQFYSNLRRAGYEIKIGKDISVRKHGMQRFFRLERNLGAAYAQDAIAQRIREQPVTRPLVERPNSRPKQYRARNYRKRKKAKGFEALFLYYCYLLGVFPKKKAGQPKRQGVVWEAVQQMNRYSEETRLLVGHHIQTADELTAYGSGVQTQIEELEKRQKALYQKRRRLEQPASNQNTGNSGPTGQNFTGDSPGATSAHDVQKLQELQRELEQVNAALRKLRKEVILCSDILKRSEQVQQTTAAVREDSRNQQKEREQHEYSGRVR